ncbi:hypothetical protein [Aquisalibacillus elongatus]|uniref:Uncharacterized protein n=1 Tax=Aquisalibacillus elongatus TaxID=485577 RepID=A0A3N5C1M5_9BACI|nr:hypothetical protein [Aquisalibacillus elongatus]RPF50081.1 hypothetical protein EDC24_2898 [Aquisalibacillus elongatus]
MSSHVDLWKLIKVISVFCVAIGVPSFFYFFGYRLTGSTEVDFNLISYTNPFFYFNVLVILFGAIAGMVGQSVERNNYTFQSTIIFSVVVRIALMIFIIAILSWIIV